MADDEYHTSGADSAKVVPAQCSSLRKGGFVMLKGHACKIVEMSTSKTGKHGHAKVSNRFVWTITHYSVHSCYF